MKGGQRKLTMISNLGFSVLERLRKIVQYSIPLRQKDFECME